MVEDGWERVAKAVRARREALGLTQEQAAAQSAGLVSSANWRVIERGGRTSYRNATLLGVCSVLHWTNESIDLILEGGDPITTEEVGRARALDIAERDLEEARGKVHELEQIVFSIPDDDRAPFEAELEKWQTRADAARWMIEQLEQPASIPRQPTERESRIAQQILEIPARLAARQVGLPASLTGKLSQLTPEQLVALDAYIDGLIEGSKR